MNRKTVLSVTQIFFLKKRKRKKESKRVQPNRRGFKIKTHSENRKFIVAMHKEKTKELKVNK